VSGAGATLGAGHEARLPRHRHGVGKPSIVDSWCCSEETSMRDLATLPSDLDDPLAPLRQRLDAALNALDQITIRSSPYVGQAGRRRTNRLVHHLNSARSALLLAREQAEPR
jgi:hypothetical protein